MFIHPVSENAWIRIHSHLLTRTDLRELEQQHTYNEKKEIASEGEECVLKEILIKELEQIFQNFETVKFVFRCKCQKKHDSQTLEYGIS
jgi:hypothetical protein